jgi:virginiamycin B lyase
MKRSFVLVFAAAALIAALAPGASASELALVIKEYDLPTPNGRPHDPARSADGALWYTAQRANKLGRLDPATGDIREFPLKTPESGPHGLVADATGDIWFTANYAGYIGKLDPKTGAVTEYKISELRARDPHTPIFDRQGILWFTVQERNFIGRLDPKTSAMRLKPVPTANAVPYGIVLGADGVLYFCEFGSNKVGRERAG